MSLEEPDDPLATTDVGVTEEGVDYDALAELLGDTAIDRESHVNAEGFVVRPDEVQDALFTLREEAGFDHCACVTAQDYDDRYESIYHLRKYDDPTQEVSVIVPAPTENPVSQTAEPVYRTADWLTGSSFGAGTTTETSWVGSSYLRRW